MKARDMNRVISKLNNLLGKRFNVKVEYIDANDKSDTTGAVETVRRNGHAPMIIAHNQLIIPMRVEGSLAGAARVSTINHLEPKDLDQIRQTVDLILTEVIAAHSKLDVLEATQEHLEKGMASVFNIDGTKLLPSQIGIGS
jgi:hypothetical protein